MATLERHGDVHVLTLADGENRFTPDWIASVSELVEQVAALPAPRALVTAGTGKAWALGFDLDWMAAHRDEVDDLVASMHELHARMLELPVPTVAAVQGHALAGGGLFALTHDFRVMRADRGYFGLPEVDGQIALTPGLTALVKSRLAPQVAHTAIATGRPYGGADALAAGIVDQVADEGEVVDAAVAMAAPMATKDPATLGAIKAELYRDAIASLRDRSSYGGEGFARFEPAYRLTRTARA
jgi:enoyl-CoA hydratase/carnithine racemase